MASLLMPTQGGVLSEIDSDNCEQPTPPSHGNFGDSKLFGKQKSDDGYSGEKIIVL
jgi:hypothetical protein